MSPAVSAASAQKRAQHHNVTAQHDICRTRSAHCAVHRAVCAASHQDDSAAALTRHVRCLSDCRPDVWAPHAAIPGGATTCFCSRYRMAHNVCLFAVQDAAAQRSAVTMSSASAHSRPAVHGPHCQPAVLLPPETPAPHRQLAAVLPMHAKACRSLARSSGECAVERWQPWVPTRHMLVHGILE